MNKSQKSDLVRQVFKQLLVKKEINSYRLAKQTGIDKTYISKLASGAIKKPGQDKLTKIAEVLNIELTQLQTVFSQPEVAAVELNLGVVELDKLRVVSNVHQDWGNAPDGLICYGRIAEIDTVKQWISTKCSRIVTLFGLSGIGKTTLAITVVQELESEFDYIFWRNLHNTPPIESMLIDLLQSLGCEKGEEAGLDQQISLLFSRLRSLRCLLIFDQVESILATSRSRKQYKEGYEFYGELFRQIAESQHQSSLLLISTEKPREMAILEGASSFVHSLPIKGLSKSCHKILQDKELPEPERWDDLIEAYQGHPLALKIVATTIKEVFNGNLSEFLRQNTLFLGDLEFILYQEYERLSDSEKQVICAIAFSDEPVSISDLSLHFQDKMRGSEIMWSLDILTRRSLLEINQVNKISFYSTHPMVKKYLNFQC